MIEYYLNIIYSLKFSNTNKREKDTLAKQTLLEIEELRVSFRIGDDYYAAVDDVSLAIGENEVVALVGESGCGKSALALSIMGLHPPEKTKIEGRLHFKAHISHPLDENREDFFVPMSNESLTHKERKGVFLL